MRNVRTSTHIIQYFISRNELRKLAWFYILKSLYTKNFFYKLPIRKLAAHLNINQSTLFNLLAYFKTVGMVEVTNDKIIFKTNKELNKLFGLPPVTKIPFRKIVIDENETTTETVIRMEAELIKVNIQQQQFIIDKKIEDLNLIKKFQQPGPVRGEKLLKQLKRIKKLYGSDILTKTNEEVERIVIKENRTTISLKTIGRTVGRHEITAFRRMKQWTKKQIFVSSHYCRRVNISIAEWKYLRTYFPNKSYNLFVVSGVVYKRCSNTVGLVKLGGAEIRN